ncbi:MAG: hypothetical protein IJU68_03840 [Bacteroidales bacterium]|nr:hypothetical protein [Bacteroidales bacterium]
MTRRRTIALLLSAALVFAGVTTACGCQREEGVSEEDAAAQWAMGTGRLYPETVAAPPAAPRGYVPVYISHYGRHGARYMDGKGGYEAVSDVLRQASADGMLTPLGEDIWSRYSSVLPQLLGRTGELTPLGAEQHRQIAGRMARNYPRLIGRKGAKVVANSTNLERAMLSMLSFNQALLQLNPSLDITADASRTYMGRINQHSPENPKVTKEDVRWKSADAPWRPGFDRYCEGLLHPETVCGAIFKDMEYLRSLCEPVLFERKYFEVAKNLPGCPVEDCALLRAVPSDELRLLGRLENYTFYAEKSLWLGGNGRGCYLSESVLGDIIDRVPEDIAVGVRVRLRFGHDGCIMALFAMMGIEGWQSCFTDPSDAWQVWDTSRIPMAANFQMVFFAPGRSAKSPRPEDLLLLMMLNEEPLALPLQECAPGPFYRWSDFLEHYIPVLEEARAILAR